MEGINNTFFSTLKSQITFAESQEGLLRELFSGVVRRLDTSAYTVDDDSYDSNLFVTALSHRDWDLAERVVLELLSSDTKKLNRALCRTFKLLWFLRTEDEMLAISNLISLIISLGANDLTRAMLQTSLFVTLLPVCQSPQAHLATAFTQRWRADTDPETIAEFQEHFVWNLNECQVDVDLFDDRSVVEKQTYKQPAVLQRQMQLSVFEKFLNHASTETNSASFAYAYHEVCIYSIALSNTELAPLKSTSAMHLIPELLDMLVKYDGGEDLNVFFQLASNNGCVELVRILFQIARLNGLRQDLIVEMAFYVAAFNCDIAMLECLAEEVDETGIYMPFMLAAFRGCIHVVSWFVERGIVGNYHLYKALIAATCNSQEMVAAYLLRHIPQHVLVANSTALLKEVGKNNVHGVKFLLQSDFLGNPAHTYAVAESIASSDDADVTHDLKEYLLEHWSKTAFDYGRSHEEGHYVNVMRILKLGGLLSATNLQDLPPPLWIAITYLPLYEECVENGDGCLLSQRIRGKLFEATQRLGSKLALEDSPAGKEFLAQLEHYLPQFLLQKLKTRA